VAFVVAGLALVGLAGCGNSARTPKVDAAGDTSPTDAVGDSVVTDAPTCPASCDDKNDCTTDSCDPNTFQCVHAPVADGTSCEDGNTCTINDLCQGGLCFSGPYKTCTAIDQCHESGVCSPGTGECSNPNSANGKACDDGLKCTYSDQCNAGVCKGTLLACVGSAICDPDSGSCPGFPTALSAQIFENVEGPSNSNGFVRAPDGRIFVAGSFFSTTDLGSGPITTPPPSDRSTTNIFIAQLDPSTEEALWTQAFLGPQQEYVTAFAVNGAGQFGLVGSFAGAITVGDTKLKALSAGDQYILGADATNSGMVPWARRTNLIATGDAGGGSLLRTGLRGIAGDPQTSAFVLCGTATTAGTDLEPSLSGKYQGGTDVVLANLNGATGKTNWAIQVGGTNDEDCAAVAMDAQSNTYVLGTYRFGSLVSFPGLAPLPMVGAPRAAWMFLAKLDSSGKGLWLRSFGTGGQAIVPTAVLALGNDDIVVAGTIQYGDLLLDGEDLGGSAAFVGRFSGATGHAWIKGIGKGGNLTVTALAEGADGGVLLTGNYFNACTLGTTAMPAPAISGGTFAAQLDSNGGVRAAKGYGDPTSGNTAAGVIGWTDGTGDEKDSSLLLISFIGKLNMGPPVGLLSASSITTSAMCVAKLAP
jgi:hypothetical protein